MKIAIASDHGGFDLKEKLRAHYQNLLDLGTYSAESCDYPDLANRLADAVLTGKADLGIAVCGTGIGISIALNRHKKIRAAVLYNKEVAELAKQHNNANVLVFGGRTMNFEDVTERIDAFLAATYEGCRHQRRLDKLDV